VVYLTKNHSKPKLYKEQNRPFLRLVSQLSSARNVFKGTNIHRNTHWIQLEKPEFCLRTWLIITQAAVLTQSSKANCSRVCWSLELKFVSRLSSKYMTMYVNLNSNSIRNDKVRSTNLHKPTNFICRQTNAQQTNVWLTNAWRTRVTRDYPI